MSEEALHYLIVYYDVQESAGLTNQAKLAARELLRDCYDTALEAASIPAECVSSKDLGDGALILFDARIPKIRVLSGWLSAFQQRLQRGYERAADRRQVRLAIHAGEVNSSLGDHSGADLDFTARLVDAPIAKRVLAATPSAALVVIVSDAIYDQVVRHAAPALDPASFRAVTLQVKETSTSAWLHLPGWARVPLPIDSGAENPPADPAPSTEQRDGVSINGNVGVVGTATVHGPFTVNGTPGGAQ